MRPLPRLIVPSARRSDDKFEPSDSAFMCSGFTFMCPEACPTHVVCHTPVRPSIYTAIVQIPNVERMTQRKILLLCDSRIRASLNRYSKAQPVTIDMRELRRE